MPDFIPNRFLEGNDPDVRELRVKTIGPDLTTVDVVKADGTTVETTFDSHHFAGHMGSWGVSVSEGVKITPLTKEQKTVTFEETLVVNAENRARIPEGGGENDNRRGSPFVTGYSPIFNPEEEIDPAEGRVPGSGFGAFGGGGDAYLNGLVANAAGLVGADGDAAKATLKTALAEHFDARQTAREKELAALEAQVKTLRDLHDKRAGAKDEIVARRADTLLREAAGLGWGEPERGRGFGGFEIVDVPAGGFGGRLRRDGCGSRRRRGRAGRPRFRARAAGTTTASSALSRPRTRPPEVDWVAPPAGERGHPNRSPRRRRGAMGSPLGELQPY